MPGWARRPSRRIRQVPVVLLLALLVACGGGEGGGGGAGSPTRTPTADRSLDRPTDRPTADRTDRPTDRPTSDRTDGDTPTPEEPTPEEPTPEEPTPEEPTPDEPTPDEPAPTRDRSDRPEDAATEPLPEPTPRAETDEPATTTTASAVADEDDTAPSWVWWLLGALLIGTAVAVPLIVRSRRHAAWRRELAEAEGEIAWFARELLHGLRHARSREEVAGGWIVGQPRVVAAEDRLTVLESSAPDQPGRNRARELLDTSRDARARMQALTGPEPDETWALDLDAIMDDLEQVLAGRGQTPASESPE